MTKLNYLIISILMLICNISYTQNIKFYVKGGLNISNTKFSVIENKASSDRDYDNRLSFNIGGAIDFQIYKQTRLQIELLYSEQGKVSNFPSIPEQIIFELDQIIMPVLLKFKTFDELYILTGGYLEYVINAQDINGAGVKFKDEGINNFDYGVTLGLQYQFNFGGFIDAKYSLGLADLSSVEFPRSSIEWVYKNRVLQFGIGYQF